jgi:hypothetical protein
MTTLTVGGTTVTFSDDLIWADEFAWAPVEQSVERTITGALVVQTAARVAGRPITLAAEDDNSGWITRAALDQFKVWAAVPGQAMTLVYRGVSHSVIWRHQDTALDAAPVVFYSDVQSGDYYRATLRFMEI